MKRMVAASAMVMAGFVALGSAQQGARAPVAAQRLPLADRIAHTDPSKARRAASVHAGAGPMFIQSLFENDSTDTNLWFLHRGTIPPKAGIGAHFHNNCEEMFIILNGEAQFTVDGHTALVKGPAGAPVRMGHSHAIYNPTDTTVEWMNINVAAIKGMYDAYDLGDSRATAPLEPIPSFMVMRLDRTLLGPVSALFGGRGEVQARRAINATVFLGPWGYVDHLLIPPGASIGPSTDAEIGGFAYVLAGQGVVTIDGEKAPIKAHDAVAYNFNQSKSFDATGGEPLELMTIGVVKDASRRIPIVGASPLPVPARGRGNER